MWKRLYFQMQSTCYSQFLPIVQWHSSQRWKNQSRIHIETKNPTSNSQINSKQKSNACSITISDFKLYYREITIKSARYWYKTRHKDQWNRIKDPDINPCIYNQLIFDKGVQSTWWRKDNLFNKCCWENWISTCRRLKLDPSLSSCTNINSKWIKNLSIRSETLKQLQEVVGNTLEQIGIGNDFLYGTPMTQTLRKRINR
jgi:hypothetical protein